MSKNNEREEPQKVSYFLGAGASRAFDYPTTSEFVTELKKIVEPLELGILNSILSLPKVSDIEHVLKILDPIVNPDSADYLKTLFRKNEAVLNISGLEMDWNSFLRYCNKLKQNIINELFSQYEFNDNILDKALKEYQRLFSFVEIWNQLDIHVFTTNYDSIIENFCMNSENSVFSCGFRTDKRNNRQFWHPEEFKRKTSQPFARNIRLYKLHGSLDWRKTSQNRIERVPIEERISQRTKRYTENLLIYPAEKDYTKGEPFRILQKYFEQVLNSHKVCLVIGFSFRDPQINNTFLDYLRANKEHNLIVLSPSATKDVTDNLIIGEKRLEKQIKCFNYPFGSQKAYQLLSTVLVTEELDKAL